MLSGSRFAEEGIECIISTSYCFINWHLTIRLYNLQQRLEQYKATKTAGISCLSRLQTVKLLECLPGYRAQGKKAPNKHFQPERRPDQCGYKCILSCWKVRTQIPTLKYKLQPQLFWITTTQLLFVHVQDL